MPGLNVTVQQYAPLVQYAPPNAWVVGDTHDDFYSQYSDGFRPTTVNGSTATLEFHGTGVWIYGAYRPNHGNYSVTLDGDPKGVFNGSKANQFQALLFGVGELQDTTHSVVLTNVPISADHNYVDIDFITYEVQLNQKSSQNSVQVDMSSHNWTYDQSWSLENDATQGALLSSNTSDAKTTLTFQGEYVEIYGSMGPLNSKFDVSVDGGAATTLDSFYDESRPSVLLWSANSLGDRLHKLEITNRSNGTSRNRIELDYAVVRGATQDPVSIDSSTTSMSVFPTNSPLANTAFKSDTGAIIGCVIAAIVSLVIITAAAIHWWRKKRLIQRPPSSYIPPMSSSRNILPVTNPSAGSGPRGHHPKFGAHVRATPPDRVPIINDHFSSSDSNLSSNVVSRSQLSTSTATSTNIIFYPMSSPPAARAAYQPHEQSTPSLPHLPTPEPRTQPLPPAQAHPSTEPQQPHSADAYSSEQTSYPTTPSPGMQSSYAYQPHPQSIFGDGDTVPDSSRTQTMSPPPDYWTSAGQAAR